MAGRIKGITIEIDGNTQGLEKSLKGVNGTSTKLNRELKDINKLLKFDPSNTTLLAQKQRVLTDAIENTGTKLKSLKAAQSEVEAQFKSGKIDQGQYEAFQREIAETEQSLGGYKKQLSGMQTEQDKLGKNTKRLDTLFQATGTSLDDYTDILGTRMVNAIKNGTATSDQLEVAINKIGKQALGTETDLGAMKDSLDSVDDGGSIDNVKQDLDSLKSASSDTDEELGKMGGALTAGNLMQAGEVIADVGQKVIELGQNAQEAFRDLDDGMDTYTSVTGKNSDIIKESFDKIRESMPIESNAELGQALGSLDQQFGFTGDTLTQYGTQLMQFANINNADVKSSVDNAKAAIETYGLSYDDLGSVLDTFTYTSQQTGVSVDELMQKTVEGAPQIKQLGLSFDEGANLLGRFEQAGVDSSGALSSLSKANVAYAKDGKTLEEGLKGTIDSIMGAKDETEALTIASEVFGTKGATRMVDAIKRGTFSLDDLATTSEQTGGTVANTFEETVDPIDSQAVAMQQVQEAMGDLGNEIATALQPILEALIPIIKSIGEWFSNLDGPSKTFLIVIAALSAAFAVLMPVIAGIGAVFTALGAAALPIIGIIMAIIGVVALIVVAFTNWGAITDWVSEKWNQFTTFISELWNNIASSASTIFSNVKQAIVDKFNAIVATGQTVWNSFKGWIGNLWTSISNTASSVWGSVKSSVSNLVSSCVSTVKNLWNSAKNVVNGVWNSMKSTASNVWNGIKSAISNAINGARNTVSNVVNGIRNTVSGVWNGIRSITSSVWKGIKSAMTSPIQTAKNTISGIVSTVKRLFNFRLSFPRVSIPHIPLPHFRISGSFNPLKGQLPRLGLEWYAKGGILTKPTVFGQNGNNLMVGGEAGKEAVAPLSDLMAYVQAAVKAENQTQNAVMVEMLKYLKLISEKETKFELNKKTLIKEIASDIKKQNDKDNLLKNRGKGLVGI